MKFRYLYLIVLLIAACNKSDFIPTRGGNGGGVQSKIIGNVVLYDDLTNKIPSYDSMTVRIDGTTFSSITDSSGKYSFKDVPLGTYTVVYEKAGYGTYKLDTFTLAENLTDTPTIIAAKTLGQLSTTTVIDMFPSIEGDFVKLVATIDPAGNGTDARGVRFFYGNDSLVTNQNFYAYSGVYGAKSPNVSEKIDKTDFYNMGFNSGDTIYVKAYGDAFFSNDYIDVASGKRIFPNLNPNTTSFKSFVLP